MIHRPDASKDTGDGKEQEVAAQLSSYEILRKIHPSALKIEAIRGEIDIHQDLQTLIEQLRRKSHQAWIDFPDALIAHGEALVAYGQELIQQGRRLTDAPPMPTQHEPLRKSQSVVPRGGI
jgi:hypothetical protein